VTSTGTVDSFSSNRNIQALPVKSLGKKARVIVVVAAAVVVVEVVEVVEAVVVVVVVADVVVT